MSNPVVIGPSAREGRLSFTDDDADVELRFDPHDQAIWATYQNIADVFGVDYSTIRKHIKNIYEDGELEKSATQAKIALVQNEGGREVVREGVLHFNLDMIISVGY